MIHFMQHDLPSPNMVRKKTKKTEAPMVIAHFNKGELATLDRIQGGRTMDKKYGIPHYKGLKSIFDHKPFVEHIAKMHDIKRAQGGSIPGEEEYRASLAQDIFGRHAKGGSIKEKEHMKAHMGRMGDTERAAIPRNMANFMDKMGLSTKNPQTGDREYAMGSDFISSLGSYLPSMSSVASGLSNVASSAAPALANAASNSAAGSSGSTTPSSGGAMGSLINSLAPAAINAGMNWLTKPKDNGAATPSTPNASQPQAPTNNSATPSTNSQPANGTSPQAQPQGQQNGMDSNSLMQQLQQMLMQHGQNYLGSRNDPYSKMGAQMLGAYQRGGFQGMIPQSPQAGYEMFNNMTGGRMPQMNFGQYGPQMDGGYSPEQYQPSTPQMVQSPNRRGSSSRRTGYR